MAFINSAVMNIGVHVPLSILVSSVCVPSSGIAGSQKGTGHINRFFFFCPIQIFFFKSKESIFVWNMLRRTAKEFIRTSLYFST